MVDRLEDTRGVGLAGEVDACLVGQPGKFLVVAITHHDGQCVATHHVFIGA